MGHSPVRVTAHSEPGRRWLWLVKWLLLVPHYVVLAVLWVAFAVLTLVAYAAILFTGRPGDQRPPGPSAGSGPPMRTQSPVVAPLGG
ncbi:hypothetical protein [Dactylosporangium sp. NPDC049140]|uniref:hypothetical protein n=1 Tax=Dactylosporangium sp. NPDC049140 TaxID=3155647 RepID=UPI0033D31AB7